MIIVQCKKLKYKRKIVLVTNGQGYMSNEGLDQIISKIKEDNIELIVLWVPTEYLTTCANLLQWC